MFIRSFSEEEEDKESYYAQVLGALIERIENKAQSPTYTEELSEYDACDTEKSYSKLDKSFPIVIRPFLQDISADEEYERYHAFFEYTITISELMKAASTPIFAIEVEVSSVYCIRLLIYF